MKNTLISILLIIFSKSFSQSDKIKVFLSCNCDSEFIKQNTLFFFDYDSDRTLSDIEVFVFEITNGIGGRYYSFDYKGKNNFKDLKNKINLDIPII